MGNRSELFKVKILAEAIDSLKPYMHSFYQRIERVPLADSLGRIVAQDLPAISALPHFRKSTHYMDFFRNCFPKPISFLKFHPFIIKDPF